MDAKRQEELAEIIGEGVHTYLRKLCESREANAAYVNILDMPDEEWNKVCRAVAENVHEQFNQEISILRADGDPDGKDVPTSLVIDYRGRGAVYTKET